MESVPERRGKHLQTWQKKNNTGRVGRETSTDTVDNTDNFVYVTKYRNRTG